VRSFEAHVSIPATFSRMPDPTQTCATLRDNVSRFHCDESSIGAAGESWRLFSSRAGHARGGSAGKLR
jgi:hypothetical protein